MKITHRRVDVKIVHYGTAADALLSGLGKRHRETDGLVIGLLNEQLGNEHKEDKSYLRCALVSLESEIGVRELYNFLYERDCYPASFSEGMSYLRLIRKCGVAIGTVLHLGTFIRGEDFREQRFLTRGDGTIRLIDFYPDMKLKTCYDIVVVEKERFNK